jgi:predicted RNA binding protein YcfA (HicA-like mRNA interferase family)
LREVHSIEGIERTVYARYGSPAMPTKVKDLIAFLESDGWFLVRSKGSHRQFHHPLKRGTVTVAGKASTDVPPATLASVLRQAGLKKESSCGLSRRH